MKKYIINNASQVRSTARSHHHYTRENLNIKYDEHFLYDKKATELLLALETEIQYFTGSLARVQVFGKWHPVPRKQAAYGEPGLTYTFSGITVPTKAWTPSLLRLKDQLLDVTGVNYNFVLINRYKDGQDYMGEHRDNEAEIDSTCPIASISLGSERDFIFRHKNARCKTTNQKSDVPKTLKMKLGSGSLLLMYPPTNEHWYHSLPKRKSCRGVRVNLTFRKIVPSKCKATKQ